MSIFKEIKEKRDLERQEFLEATKEATKVVDSLLGDFRASDKFSVSEFNSVKSVSRRIGYDNKFSLITFNIYKSRSSIKVDIQVNYSNIITGNLFNKKGTVVFNDSGGSSKVSEARQKLRGYLLLYLGLLVDYGVVKEEDLDLG